MRHKFNAVRTEINGVSFPSKKEAKRYQELLYAQLSGDLLFFLRQVPFHLPGNIRYLVDFVSFWKSGEITFEEVKGFATKEWTTKKKIVESLYTIKITVL